MLFHKFAVADHIDGDARIDVSEDVKTDFDVFGDLDHVLVSHLGAGNVHQDCNGAFELVEFKNAVKLHSLARLDVVEYDTVLDRINMQHVLPPYFASRPSSIMMSAARMNLPLSTCLK